MKYVIFGDIHSNLEALKTFFLLTDPLKNIKRICLGDIVGYAAHPNECIEMIQKRDIPAVMGNHELAILNPIERETFNHVARKAIEWQSATIHDQNRKTISRFPYTLHFDGLFDVTHANFFNPEIFSYMNSDEEAERAFSALQTNLGFFGHTHVPRIYTQNPHPGRTEPIQMETIYGEKVKITLENNKRYLINPGSLGQPRDGDPRAAYAVLDSEEMSVTFHRIPYDVEKEARHVRETHLPDILATRLLVGY
ncbi:MAG: metallophosphoesterase [Candidatus Omnitrophota bacterium]|jgi:diadenosine tetraphosphatase ApaH/serine/threonine PP2A family protein phosphatase|nr:MAG: metallophosphoesterase [Candidatus Omnitrophota bacterium]